MLRRLDSDNFDAMSERPVDFREFLQQPTLLSVTHCEDCPMTDVRAVHDEYSRCSHPQAPKGLSARFYGKPPPDGCPLRRGPLTIQLTPSAR